MKKARDFLNHYQKTVIPAAVLILLLSVTGIYLLSQPKTEQMPKSNITAEEQTEKKSAEESAQNIENTDQDEIKEDTAVISSSEKQDTETVSVVKESRPVEKKNDTVSHPESVSDHSSETSVPTHQHVWKNHTAKKWVSKMVSVDDYKTTTVYGAKFYVYNGTNDLGQPTYIAKGPTYWFENGFTSEDLQDIIYEALLNADENGLYNGVYYGNYQNVSKTERVKTGSHQEDHGEYETYVDYQYCDCGAKK